MKLNEIHFAQIGQQFKLERVHFLSKQNLLEYDAIIMSLATLVHESTHESLDLIDHRINDLSEFSKVKKIPVILTYDGNNFFPDSMGIRRPFLERMGIEMTTINGNGRKIDPNMSSLFADFLLEYHDKFEYGICFSSTPGVPIGNAKEKAHMYVGCYTQEFVILPSIRREVSDQFLIDLYEVCKKVWNSDIDQIELPKWTKDYLLPGEKDDRNNLLVIEKEIDKLQQAKLEMEVKLAKYQPIKRLWSSSGSELEIAVRDVFIELGFNMLPSDAGRDDILMEWKGKPIVGEVKGLSKSAAEKNAAQLEKWVSLHIERHDVQPKALLVVNTFRNLPLSERLENSFPHQMLNYSKNREHVLMTTLQLCNLLLYCRKHSEQRETVIEKLLGTIGILEGFDQWDESIEGLTVVKKKANSKKRKSDSYLQ